MQPQLLGLISQGTGIDYRKRAGGGRG